MGRDIVVLFLFVNRYFEFFLSKIAKGGAGAKPYVRSLFGGPGKRLQSSAFALSVPSAWFEVCVGGLRAALLLMPAE